MLLRCSLLLCLWLCAALGSQAQSMYQAQLSRTQLAKGDTLQLATHIAQWQQAGTNGVWHVWITNSSQTQQWRLRYPILKGVAEASLVLDNSFPDDHYTVLCQWHTQPFFINARLSEAYKRDSVRFTMTMANGDIISGGLAVKDNRRFWLGRMVFEDKANIYFSPDGRYKENTLNASIITPLDSTFTPLADTVMHFTMGTPKQFPMAKPITRQSFFLADSNTLQTVEVVGQRKSSIERFDEEVPTGMFRGSNALIFDGTGNEMSRFVSVFDYLRGRVAGLQFVRNSTFPGNFDVNWRGAVPNFYINELEVTKETLNTVSMSDVAMIKVFRPPFNGAFLGGPGGAIAVYTKTGGTRYGKSSTYLNSFVVNGYTPALYVLRVPLDGKLIGE